MWPYFGSKHSFAKYYPRPLYDRIIEPFAGSARYSLRHFEHDIMLVDRYEVIVNIWRWLQQASEADILSLPILEPGEDLRDIKTLDEPARDLLAFLTQIQSAHRTYIQAAGSARRDLPKRIRYIAKNLYKVRHWRVYCGDYHEISNQPATWFIDPPYQYGGEAYIEGNKSLDYAELAAWCRSREGQSIVCENTRADWMDFKPMRRNSGVKHITTEALWSNLQTQYDYRQMDFFPRFASIDR